MTSSLSQMESLIDNQLAEDDFDSPPHEQDDGANGAKRKAEDGSLPQQRTKRNRYISIACNECKRRKIKCNGQTPCQRCGNLNLGCVYAPNCCNGFKDSQEFKDTSARISLLQDQVNALYHELNSLRTQLTSALTVHGQTPIDPNLHSGPYLSNRSPYPNLQASPGAPIAAMSPTNMRPKSQSQSGQPTFRGPTSSVFNIGVAKSSLKTMGITGQNDGGGDGSGAAGTGTREPSPIGTPPSQQIVQSFHSEKDPIWSVSQEEAIRLCRAYEDEMGLMYPVLDIEKVIAYARKLYRFMEAAHRSGLMQQGFPGADAIDDDDTNILKLVLATAMITEAGGKSDIGRKMFEYVQPAIDNLLLGTVGIKGIKLLTMAAMYEFHRDNEGNSWRLIGLTARLCIELGLHRRETYEALQDESERYECVLLFWAIYVLDRRWSLGTGMPFALQDADIDPLLPKPEDRSPYLSAMIQYSAIGAKVWRSVISTSSPSTGGAPINTEEMGYLDYQVLQWHRNLPAHLRFEHPSRTGSVATPIGPAQSRAENRLRILLYLRMNQMRILIYRPVLHSATSIMQHRDQAQTVVEISKDSIHVLTHINQTSDLYRSQQMLFNAFLTSALAVLFLAVAHTPATFAETVRAEWDMAIELVRGFSKGSLVGKRLWKTVRVLYEVAPKLGLRSKDNEPVRRNSYHAKGELDPSRSAAVAMAGLAGHNVDEMALFQGTSRGWHADSVSNTSPNALADDLSTLFEAAGGYQAVGNGNEGTIQDQDGLFHGPNNGNDGIDSMVHVYGGDEGLSNILKELF